MSCFCTREEWFQKEKSKSQQGMVSSPEFDFWGKGVYSGWKKLKVWSDFILVVNMHK